MSAFQVSDNHINVIVWAAIKYKIMVKASGHDFHNSTFKILMKEHYCHELGTRLLGENLRSLDFRYPEDRDKSLNNDILRTYQYNAPDREYLVIELFHIINCYEYQSCEHDDFEKSWAKHFCLMLKETLIRELPDYKKCEVWAV